MYTMKNIKTISLLFLFAYVTCAQVQAASFNCDHAHSKPEKLICDHEELSELDTHLGEAYSTAKQNASAGEAKRLRREQLQWLRKIRNRCADAACLLATYKGRLNELDPFADKQLTCDEMKKFPERIFSDGIDLGSGSGSPIDVDYGCPESLSQQKFLQKLLDLAEQIRRDGGPQICSGTIVHALWRYYHFSLAEAGFSPRKLLSNTTSARVGIDWNAFAREDGNDEKTRVFRYFKQWSERSLFNLRLYSDFTTEFNRVLPRLSKHYEQKFRLSRSDAQSAAKNALMLVVQRAAGSFPSDNLEPDSALVQLARDSQATPSDYRRALGDDMGERNQYTEEDVYQALIVALIHNRPLPIVSALTERLSPETLQRPDESKEPLLSFALGYQQNLKYLLSKKAPVNAANDFGKTALFYAIGSSNHEAVETLLKYGANVNHAYKSGKELRPDDDECTYAGLNHTGRTPLMHAAQNSDVQMLKILVQARPRLDVSDDLGFNALDYAVLGKNKDNEIYLRSLGLEFGAPKYTSEADSAVREQKIQESVAIDGYVSRLLVAPGRPDILVAAVMPWDTLVAGDKHGLYLISIADPVHPEVISKFAGVYVNDFTLSPDGERAYLLEIAHDKSPPGKRFGVSIIDISNPERPKLAEQIEGDFMALHLSPDGETLYLQERSLRAEFSRGLLVYSVGADRTRMRCSNPFGRSDVYGPIFAYAFVSFPNEPLLLIHDRSRRLVLFDVKDPCAPTRVSEISTENVGGQMFGGAERTIVSGSSGLQKFHIADSLERITGYEASVGAFHVNVTTGFVTAAIGRDVAVFRTNPRGQFVLTDRFRLTADNVGSVLQTNTGHIYMGWKGGLGVGVIPRE